MAAIPPKPTKPKPQPQLTELDYHARNQELGFFGQLFGTKDNAPTYIAGIIAIVALVGAIAVAALEPSTQTDKADIVKTLVGVVVSALTFIGGASTRSR